MAEKVCPNCLKRPAGPETPYGPKGCVVCQPGVDEAVVYKLRSMGATSINVVIYRKEAQHE